MQNVRGRNRHSGQGHDQAAPQRPSQNRIVEALHQEQNRDRLKPYPLPILVRMFMGVFLSNYVSEVLFAPKAPSEFSKNARDYFREVFLHGVLQPSG